MPVVRVFEGGGETHWLDGGGRRGIIVVSVLVEGGGRLKSELLYEINSWFGCWERSAWGGGYN